MIRHEKHWADLYWLMADGDKTQYDALKKTPVIEFFHLLRAFETKLKKQVKNGSRI